MKITISPETFPLAVEIVEKLNQKEFYDTIEAKIGEKNTVNGIDISDRPSPSEVFYSVIETCFDDKRVSLSDLSKAELQMMLNVGPTEKDFKTYGFSCDREWLDGIMSEMKSRIYRKCGK